MATLLFWFQCPPLPSTPHFLSSSFQIWILCQNLPTREHKVRGVVFVLKKFLFKLFLTTYMKIKKIVCRKGCETSKHCLGHICYRYINHILTFQMSRDILLFQQAQCVLVHFGIFYQSEETSLQVYTYVSREVIQIRVMGTGSVIFVH